MTTKKWADLDGHDFTKYPLTFQIEEAVKELRKMPAKEADFVEGYDHFFGAAMKVFVDALWLDARNALQRCEAPVLPDAVQVEEDDWWPLTHDSLFLAWEWAVEHNKLELEMMFIVLAKCLHDRLIHIKAVLLSGPKDWWIRLVVARVLADFVDTCPNLVEAEPSEAE